MTTYRKWTIEWCDHAGAYIATSDNYEPTWLGEGEGWLDGERFEAPTVEYAIAEIDLIEAEREPAG